MKSRIGKQLEIAGVVIVQMGNHDIPDGFGADAECAAQQALSALIQPFDDTLYEYTRAWNEYQAECLPLDRFAGNINYYRVSTALLNFVQGEDLSDVPAAAARLKPGTRERVAFVTKPEGRITDFHYVLLPKKEGRHRKR